VWRRRRPWLAAPEFGGVFWFSQLRSMDGFQKIEQEEHEEMKDMKEVLPDLGGK
jgi:hypothetical protein